jgi:hypothetical protein
MNLTPRQKEMLVLVANWFNRAIPESPLVVVPRWRLQELKHEDIDSDSLSRDFNWHKRLALVVSLMLLLLERDCYSTSTALALALLRRLYSLTYLRLQVLQPLRPSRLTRSG